MGSLHTSPPGPKVGEIEGTFMKHYILAAALALAACSPQPAPASEAAAVAPPAAETSAPAAEFKASGPARTIAAEPKDMEAAWVTDVRMIKDTDAKIFSTAGGDPAINGLYTYLALFTAPDGWTRVFQIGDFNSWEVVQESPTQVVLKVSRSWIEEGSGDVKTADEHLILKIPADGETMLEVTPAA